VWKEEVSSRCSRISKLDREISIRNELKLNFEETFSMQMKQQERMSFKDLKAENIAKKSEMASDACFLSK
jgi:hypothetical protein